MISGNNLTAKSTFKLVKNYLKDQEILEKLDLSWSFFSTRHLRELSEILKIKTIQDLNLAYNSLDNSSTEDCQQVVENISSLISNNSYLQHLDFSGLQLGIYTESLLLPILNSKSLCAVHLSDNQIPRETRQFIYNVLNQSSHETR